MWTHAQILESASGYFAALAALELGGVNILETSEKIVSEKVKAFWFKVFDISTWVILAATVVMWAVLYHADVMERIGIPIYLALIMLATMHFSLLGVSLRYTRDHLFGAKFLGQWTLVGSLALFTFAKLMQTL